MTALERIVADLRADAERFAVVHAQVDGATVYSRLADRLEATLLAYETEPLTLDAAAREVNVSYTTMQRRVARGDVPNIGRRGAPRVRRCDLHGTPTGPNLAVRVLRDA